MAACVLLGLPDTLPLYTLNLWKVEGHRAGMQFRQMAPNVTKLPNAGMHQSCHSAQCYRFACTPIFQSSRAAGCWDACRLHSCHGMQSVVLGVSVSCKHDQAIKEPINVPSHLDLGALHTCGKRGTRGSRKSVCLCVSHHACSRVLHLWCMCGQGGALTTCAARVARGPQRHQLLFKFWITAG